MRLAHIRDTDAARVSVDAHTGAAKPVSTEQLAKLAIGRRRARFVFAGRQRRAVTIRRIGDG